MPVGQIIRFPATRAARDRYLSELKSIYGAGTEVPDPDYALLNDPEIYAKMERDPVIYSALDYRLKSVIGQTWHMEPGSDAKVDKTAAAVVEEMLSGIKNFQQSRLMIFRAALLMGRGYGWTVGRRHRVGSIGGRVVQNPWLPSAVEQDDKRRFQYIPERDENHVGQKLEYYDLLHEEWVALGEAQRRALICLVYNDRADRLGMGQGIGVSLYHWFRQKALAWRDWAQASERWAQGIVAMKVNQDREGSATNATIRDEALDTLDQMRSRHALVYGDGEEVNIFETSGSGQQISESQIEKIDKDILRLITGSVRPMGGDTDTGARAQAETESETTDVIIAYDRSQVDESMTETVVRCVWELNRPVLTALGLSGAKMPRFATSPERKSDPSKAVTVIAQALGAQIPLRKVDVYEALGMQQPAEDDAVFEGQAPQPAGVPGALPSMHFGSIERCPDGSFKPADGD